VVRIVNLAGRGSNQTGTKKWTTTDFVAVGFASFLAIALGVVFFVVAGSIRPAVIPVCVGIVCVIIGLGVATLGVVEWRRAKR
jgi:hypothetical protein